MMFKMITIALCMAASVNAEGHTATCKNLCQTYRDAGTFDAMNAASPGTGDNAFALCNTACETSSTGVTGGLMSDDMDDADDAHDDHDDDDAGPMIAMTKSCPSQLAACTGSSVCATFLAAAIAQDAPPDVKAAAAAGAEASALLECYLGIVADAGVDVIASALATATLAAASDLCVQATKAEKSRDAFERLEDQIEAHAKANCESMCKMVEEHTFKDCSEFDKACLAEATATYGTNKVYGTFKQYCPTSLNACNANTKCKKFLEDSSASDDDGMPVEADFDAVGPEAVALFKCYSAVYSGGEAEVDDDHAYYFQATEDRFEFMKRCPESLLSGFDMCVLTEGTHDGYDDTFLTRQEYMDQDDKFENMTCIESCTKIRAGEMEMYDDEYEEYDDNHPYKMAVEMASAANVCKVFDEAVVAAKATCETAGTCAAVNAAVSAATKEQAAADSFASSSAKTIQAAASLVGAAVMAWVM